MDSDKPMGLRYGRKVAKVPWAAFGTLSLPSVFQSLVSLACNTALPSSSLIHRLRDHRLVARTKSGMAVKQ